MAKMHGLPFCSIVILNYNGKKYLKDCLAALRNVDYPKNRMEVILVDNNSTDGSVRYVNRGFPWVKTLKLDDNYGFSQGNNSGLDIAKGSYIIFLNNDTEVEKEWLKELVNVAQSDKSIGICGSKIKNFSGNELRNIAGEGYLNMLGIPRFSSGAKEPKPCFYVSGCSLLIKKSVIRDLGYCFDDRYFLYFEDIDLCWRARLNGYKVVYVPTSVVNHKKAMTSAMIGKIVDYYHYRNKIWTFKKNLRTPLMEIVLPFVAVSTIFMIAYWTYRKRWRYGIEVLKHLFSRIEKSPGLDRVPLKRQLKLFYSYS
jgi:GT2 family glycosyltransferase